MLAFLLTITVWWLSGLLVVVRLAQLSLRLQRAAYKRLRWAMPPQATVGRLVWFAVARNGLWSFLLIPLIGWYWMLRPRSAKRTFIAYGAMASARLDKMMDDDVDKLSVIVWGWEAQWAPPDDEETR